MSMVPTGAAFRSFLDRFKGDRDGVSAVEFAIILPFMLALYVGGTELGDGLAIQFKVVQTSRTVTDLASQYVSINNVTMSNILAASASVVSPYPATNMVVTLSEVTTDSKGKGTITWSCSLNGTAHPVNQAVTLPTNLQTANISLLWGEVTYPYTPAIGYAVTGTFNIYQSTYFYPRMVNSVTGPASC